MKFKLDNPVFDFINTLCNYVLLNLVFLLTCIPVITIGASVTALYKVMFREVRKDHGYLVRTYLKEWKTTLAKSTLAFVLLAALALVFFFNFAFWSNFSSAFSGLITIVMGIALILLLLTADYVFPLLSETDDRLLNTIKKGLFFALSDPRYSIPLLAIDGALIALFIYVPAVRVLMMTFGFAYLCYGKAALMEKKFKSMQS